LNILEQGSIKDSDFDKFDSDMREVLKYIKYSKDYDALENMLTNDKAYSKLKRKTAELINIVTNSNMKFKEEGAVVDMCQAIVDMKRIAKQEGRIEGEIEGEAKLASLMTNLFLAGRVDEAKQVVVDRAIREKLYHEFQLK